MACEVPRLDLTAGLWLLIGGYRGLGCGRSSRYWVSRLIWLFSWVVAQAFITLMIMGIYSGYVWYRWLEPWCSGSENLSWPMVAMGKLPLAVQDRPLSAASTYKRGLHGRHSPPRPETDTREIFEHRI